MNKIIDFLPVKQDQSALSAFGMASYAYSNLEDIRGLATKAMMILCPIEYFDIENATKDAMFYGDDKELVLKSINNFIDHFKDNANVYALCPPQFYDMTKHARSEVDKQIFAGQFQQSFFSISMVLPMIRDLQGQINSLDSRVSNLERAQQQVQEQLRQQSRNILLNDPMLLAIPKESTIFDHTNAILGTCWGADIDANVIEGLNVQSAVRLSTINNMASLSTNKKELGKLEDLKIENAKLMADIRKAESHIKIKDEFIEQMQRIDSSLHPSGFLWNHPYDYHTYPG